MNRDEIIDELIRLEYPSGRTLAGRVFKSLRDSICHHTSFLDGMKNASISFRIQCILDNIQEIPKCPICGNRVSINLNPKNTQPYRSYGFSTYCSRQCAKSSPDRAKKAMATMIARYGDHNMRTEQGKKKFQDSLEASWGVRHPMENKDIANRALIDPNTGNYRILAQDTMSKAQSTRNKNWDGGHHMRDPLYMMNRKKASVEKWGTPYPNQNHIVYSSLDVLNDKNKLQEMIDRCEYMKFAAIELGVHQSTIQRACSSLGVNINQRHKSSIAEIELFDMISQYCDDVRMSDRTILSSGLEVDIFVPSKKLAIEFNGLYWHSEKFRSKTYHQQKSLEAHDAGIMLIHVWEDDWKNPQRRKIIENKIKSKMGISSSTIYARSTTVGIVDSKEAHMFMDVNHIQGKTTASHWIGLRDDRGNLVACMGIKRLPTADHWDLVRYATSKTVVGGFSKCLKFFERNYEWEHIITYAALDYSNGNLYDKTGFVRDGVTVPGMWYVKGDNRYRRESFMKHKLKDKLESFDSSLTEWENMTNHGFLRLFDSGSIRYVKTP